jgi:glycine oxidase
VGATVEEVGFDARVTAGNVQSILGLGAALVPSLGDADLNWGLAGLRPGSDDAMPVIGPLPEYENVHIASGHFRNGILLSLATGEAIAGMLDGSPSDNLASFSPARFL